MAEDKLETSVEMSQQLAASKVSTVMEITNLTNLLFSQKLTGLSYGFSFWQVETLLNQTQELLDRIQRESNTRDDLKAQALSLSLQSFYEAKELEKLKARLFDATPLGDDERQPIYRLAALAANAEYESIIKVSNQDATPNWYLDASWRTVDSRLANAQDIRQHNGDAASVGQLVAERYKYILDIWAKQQHIPALKYNAQLANADAEQFAASLNYLDNIAKVKAGALESGGAYDFAPRITQLGEQIVNDFRDAYARLMAIQKGLVNVFGYDKDESYTALPSETKNTTMTDWVVWTRKAAAWLVAFNHADYTTVITLPLSIITADQWKKHSSNLNNGEECTFEFSWDGGVIGQSFYCCRLRGLTASVVGDLDTILSGSVQLPKIGRVRHVNGNWKDIIQPVGDCVLGRIGSNLLGREPELEGAISHRNLSPISAEVDDVNNRRWVVKLQKLAGGNPIKDVYLEVSIAYSAGGR